MKKSKYGVLIVYIGTHFIFDPTNTLEVSIIKIQKEKKYKNISYYKCNNIHFVCLKIRRIILSCFWEFQGPIWKIPKIEFHKDKTEGTRAIRIGWLYLAFGFGIRRIKLNCSKPPHL